MLPTLEARLVSLLTELGGAEITGADLRLMYNDRYPPTFLWWRLSPDWFGVSIVTFYSVMSQLVEDGYISARDSSDRFGPLRYYRTRTIPAA